MNIQDTHPPDSATLSPRLSSDSSISLPSPLTLQRVEQLLKDLQTLQEDHYNHHHHAQRVVQGLNRSFTQHIQALNRLWTWGEDHNISDLPSFSEWLDTPVEPTLTSWPNQDIMSGVNPLDTQILKQHGWQKKEIGAATYTTPESRAQGVEAGSLNAAPVSESKSTTTAKETSFQMLLRDLLDQADQCRTLLAKLDLLQTRSHQTDQTQDYHLQHTEDLLTTSSLKPFDSFFQELQVQWDQKTVTANCSLTLVIPEQDTYIWIEAKPYDALLQGFSTLLDAWLKIWREKNEPLTDPASSSSGRPPAPTITLKLKIQGKSLILEWDEATPMHQSAVMDGAVLQEAWVGKDIPWSIDVTAQPPSERSTHPEDRAEGHAEDDVEGHAEGHAEDLIIEAASDPNARHSQTIFQMPLAPARCKQLICRVNDDLYGLSLEPMEQLILPKAEQLKMATGGVLMLKWQLDQHDQLLRIYPLSQLIQYSHSASWVGRQHRQRLDALGDPAPSSSALDLTPTSSAGTPLPSPPSSPGAQIAPAPIVLLHISQQWVGIMVNEVVTEKMILLRPLSGAIAAPLWIQGCSLVHEHQFALSIDLKLLLRQAVGFGL